tara:strand:- start:1350 stop:1610 length:261 start_codon:yes stop_codon:yes gene_type:complete
MKAPDYLHSTLLTHKNNDKVFQAVYNTINKITKRVTHAEMQHHGVKLGKKEPNDVRLAQELETKNAEIIGQTVINLINYTIHNFKK